MLRRPLRHLLKGEVRDSPSPIVLSCSYFKFMFDNRGLICSKMNGFFLLFSPLLTYFDMIFDICCFEVHLGPLSFFYHSSLYYLSTPLIKLWTILSISFHIIDSLLEKWSSMLCAINRYLSFNYINLTTTKVRLFPSVPIKY